MADEQETVPTVDEERIRDVYEDLSQMEVALDRDPLIYGPKRLNEKTADVRHFLTRTERIFLGLAQDLALLKRKLRIAQADFKIAEQDLLANDPVVRSGRSVKDREALAAMKLRDEVELLTDLEAAINDLEACLTVVKAKRTDLKDVQRALRDQIKLCQEEIGLGNNWGSRLPPNTKSPIDQSLVGSTADMNDTINDLIGDIEGDINLARESGEWVDSDDEEEEDEGTEETDESDESDEDEGTDESDEEVIEEEWEEIVPPSKDEPKAPKESHEDLGDVELDLEMEAVVEAAITQAEVDITDETPNEDTSLDDVVADVLGELDTPTSKPEPKPVLTDFPMVGYCGVEGCGKPQYQTQGGLVCEDGHGGAPTLDEPPEPEEEPDYGLTHYASETPTCKGGRNDTGTWDDVTCPDCLRSKPEPEIKLEPGKPEKGALAATATTSDTDDFFDNLDLTPPPSAGKMLPPDADLDLDDLIGMFK